MRAADLPDATASLADRVAVLAPLGRDAAVICKALAESAIATTVAESIADLFVLIRSGIGSVVVAEEALTPAAVDTLSKVLAGQPSWSDLPVVLLLADGERLTPEGNRPVVVLRTAGNVTVLVRPVPGVALMTAVQAALRARMRQYEVRDLLRREQAARLEAEDANRLKDEFLATVSHELRTPLSAILLWCRLLAGGKVEPERFGEALESIERSARSQSRLIEDLLDVSRMVGGKLQLRVEEIELAPVAEDALAVVRPMAEAKNIQLASIIDPAAGRVLADADRIRQIIWNLLGNAVKFTPAGGRVSIDLRRRAQHVSIHIADDGEGIAPEFLSHVFERFRQADAASTRRHSGLGLGLAITQQLVELHGGSVNVRSAGLGKGTTFSVSLPLARQPEDAADGGSDHRAGDGSEATRSLATLRILLVEDEPATRAGLVLALEDAGAEVVAATSASGALDALKAGSRGHRADVLVSDLGMPGDDGYALIAAVRALGHDADALPSLAISAYADSEHRERALRSGFQTYLPKPVDPQDLVDAVLRLASRATAIAEDR